MLFGSLQILGPVTQTANSAIQIAAGTSAQRPTAVEGQIRYNTENDRYEGYVGGSTNSWVNFGGGDGTVTSVALSGSTGLSVSGSPITTSGTITLTLGSELQALAGLASNGMIVRTANATYSARSIAASTAAGDEGISVVNGNGVSGNPTIGLDIAGLTASSGVLDADQFVTYDGTNNTRATVTQLATRLANTFVSLSGATMTGALILNADPSAALGAATKQYVDNLVQGMTWKNAVRAATTTAGTLATSFANGQSIDGVTLATNDRILVKNQATAAENGIYVVNASGAPTRASDANTWAELVNAAVFVSEGTSNADVAFVCSSNGSGTLGSTAVTFVQFSSAGSYTAGTGLTLTGSTFSVNTSGVTTGIVSSNVIVRSTATTGQVMLSSGTAGAEATWGAVNLASSNAVTGTLPVANGGTGVTSSTGTGSVVLSASPTFTGVPLSTTAAVDTNTTQIATTAFVVGQAGSATPLINGTAAVGSSLRYARQDHVHPTDTTRAALASPTFTGTPAAPTAAADTNTTQLATTAFVIGQAGTATPLINGTAAVGTSLRFSRQDHVHPTDTTRAPLASPTFTGTVVLPTGTTSAAPLRFVSGTNLTTPVAGVMEWNGTNLFITQTSGPTRKTIAYTDSNITGTAANVSGVVAVANGGTGGTTAADARTNLGVPGVYRTSFTNASLSAGILTVTHSLGQQFVGVTVYDNTSKKIQPDDITATSTTVTTIDLSSFGTLTGTYNVVVIG